MKYRIDEMCGIHRWHREALKRCGILYADQLATMNQEAVSAQTKIPIPDLARYQKCVRLMVIARLGPESANLLIRPEVGIDTLGRLAQADADELFLQIKSANQRHRVMKVLPSLKRIKQWIQAAKNYTPPSNP